MLKKIKNVLQDVIFFARIFITARKTDLLLCAEKNIMKKNKKTFKKVLTVEFCHDIIYERLNESDRYLKTKQN